MKKQTSYSSKSIGIPKNDNRYKKFQKQIKKWGFCDSEIWCLYYELCDFLLPRLKRFKEITPCYSGDLNNLEEWNSVLDEMIFALQWIMDYTKMKGLYLDCAKSEINRKLVDEYDKRCEKGLKLLAKYFRALWC